MTVCQVKVVYRIYSKGHHSDDLSVRRLFMDTYLIAGAYMLLLLIVIQLGSLQVQRHEKLTKEVISANVGGKKGHNNPSVTCCSLQ